MRFDSVGMFWEDAAKVKAPKKEKIVRTPPEPVWLRSDYLPNLELARAVTIDAFDHQSLTEAACRRHPVVFDAESYPNYFLLSFQDTVTKKTAVFERSAEFGLDFDNRALHWCMTNLHLVGFNCHNYDTPIALIAAAGHTSDDLWEATRLLIEYGQWPQQVFKEYGVKWAKVDAIDLIELTALRPSLKRIAASLHSPIMQDLPFPPGTRLTIDQATIIRWYNLKADLYNTTKLFEDCKEDLELRAELGEMFNIDVRSKSDAQISEAVIEHEVKKRLGLRKLEKPKFTGERLPFKFEMPPWLTCQSRTLWEVHELIRKAEFKIDMGGYVALPKELEKLEVKIANTVYKMGIGGLHSKDKRLVCRSNAQFVLKDRDVTSYYPRMIINSKRFPKACGQTFCPVYEGLTDMRVELKREGKTKKANGMKIVVNGGFGKTGNAYSILYGPELLIQTTLSGQLALLMLIEMLEMARIHVVSANTDGIVIYCERSREAECDAIIAQWEKQTGLETEEVRYQGVFMRDVNNYVAIYETEQKGKWYKGKGIFREESRAKVPVNRICVEAAVKFMVDQTPIEKTVRECRDFTRFTNVAYCKDGMAKDGEYLGKVGRWYMPINGSGEILNVKNGHMIPLSAGGKPCMMLPESFPDDVDFDWYIARTYEMLKTVGYLERD